MSKVNQKVNKDPLPSLGGRRYVASAEGGVNFEEEVKWGASGDVEAPIEGDDEAREEVEKTAKGD